MNLKEYHAYCKAETPTWPTECLQGWAYWTVSLGTGRENDISMTVIAGSCPSLPCEKINLQNTNTTECDGIFTADPSMDNVFTKGTTYLYFNKQTFKWYCSGTLGIYECGNDDTITHYHVCSSNDGWQDLSADSTSNWPLDNGNTATFSCIGPTTSPTKSPSSNPSTQPTSASPTIAPPTGSPTRSPSRYPTQTPTANPTLNPSTPSPTKEPTLEPTLDPSADLTTDPTNTETTTRVIVAVNKTDGSRMNNTLVGNTVQNVLIAHISDNYTLQFSQLNESIPSYAEYYLDVANLRIYLNTDEIRYETQQMLNNVTNEYKVGVDLIYIDKDYDGNVVEVSTSTVSSGYLSLYYFVFIYVSQKQSLYTDEAERGTYTSNSTPIPMDISHVAIYVVILVFFMVIISSYIYSKCISINDFYSISSLISAAIHTNDTLSDILFIINITHQPEYPSLMLMILLSVSIVFVILPIIISIYQLHHEINKWRRNDHLGQWITENITILYFLSVITGSSFSGVQFCCSNLFNLNQFEMPLNAMERNKFQNKKMYSIVLAEVRFYSNCDFSLIPVCTVFRLFVLYI